MKLKALGLLLVIALLPIVSLTAPVGAVTGVGTTLQANLILEPSVLPFIPGYTGLLVVQFLGPTGLPTPAVANGNLSLYSSNTNIISVPPTANISQGASFTSVNVTVGNQAGSVSLTAVGNGIVIANSTFTVTSSRALNIVVTPLQPVTFTGVTPTVSVALMYGSNMFATPFPVSVLLSGSPTPIQLTATIPAGSSSVDVVLPSMPKAVNETITGAASGFMTGSASITVVSAAPNGDTLALSAPSLGTGNTEAGVYLTLKGLPAKAGSSYTVYMYSSNPDVVKVPASVSINTNQTALVTLNYVGIGSSVITLVSPGLVTAQVQVVVLPTDSPSISYSGPTIIREGETYPFAISFVVGGATPINMTGAVHIFSSNINTNKITYLVSQGVGFGTLSGQSSGISTVTMTSSYTPGLVVSLNVVVVPLLTLQTYQVNVKASSVPLPGVPVNFKYANTTVDVSTNNNGVAVFQAVNSTSTAVSVPTTVTVSGVTYYFQDWSNGLTTTNINLISSTELTANYEVVQVVNYTVSVDLNTGGPLDNATALLTVNHVNSTLATTDGVMNFTELSNVKGTITFPETISISHNERYNLVSVDNGTSPVVSLNMSHITAVYSLQYFIAVFTEHGSVTGTGWYNVGSADTLALNETSVSTGLLTFNRFAGWHGAVTATQGPITKITVTGPAIINAIWVQDDTFLYAAFTGVVVAVGVIGFIMLKKYSQRPKAADSLESDVEAEGPVSDTL